MVVLFYNKIAIRLIKRGGGKGPMKPGNRQMYGANSCRIDIILKDEGVIGIRDSFVRRSFKFFEE